MFSRSGSLTIQPPPSSRDNGGNGGIPPLITFVSAWYELTSKFPKEQYYVWATNLLANVRKFYLVVFVEDSRTSKLIKQLSNNNPMVFVIIHSIKHFHLYQKYKNEFQMNHQLNHQINKLVSWELMILWCSKQRLVALVEENTSLHHHKYPPNITEYYGWCDIGYFRNRNNGFNELTPQQIQSFPNNVKLSSFDKSKIHYGLVEPDNIPYLLSFILNRRSDISLPIVPLPFNQISIAGGFFIAGGGSGSPIKAWRDMFESHIAIYFDNNYVIKDDQYIIIDLICQNQNLFNLLVEQKQPHLDNWFMFQRILS